MLAPGFKEVGAYFNDMRNSLDNPEGREKYGFLGMSAYIGSQNAASNEILSISYWRNIQGVHDYAESPVHRAGWDWWNRTVKEHPHLLISHEIYRAEAGQHENVYVNAPPTLIGMFFSFLSVWTFRVMYANG
jgi:heme-degrading monooxygenase HmoA